MEVFTIPMETAVAWLKGEIGENELRAVANTKPDFIFLMTLENLADYRPLLAACRKAARAGTMALAVRTKNPICKVHCEKLGCRVMSVENHPNGEVHWRIVALPTEFIKWVRVKRIIT